MEFVDTPSEPWKEFEDLVRRILEAVDFKVERHSPRGDKGFDFSGSLDVEKFAIEVKYYRTSRAQPRLIEAAAARVANNSGGPLDRKGLLIVSCVLPEPQRKALVEKFSISIFDRSDLETLTSEKPLLNEELSALLGSNLSQFLETEKPSDPLKRERPAPRKTVAPEDTLGTTLCTHIRAVQPGKEEWALYEALCVDSLSYLFKNDLHGGRRQNRTDDGLNRFDFVCRLRPTTEFWRFLIDHLNSRYVVFEFKNYTGMISQGQVLTTEKYLLERGLRRVAIILSRKGADENAHKMAQGAMREHGKLILVLDDDKLCAMLRSKERGEDPSDLLFEWADDFLLKLPR
jgi:hypothetical protein